MRTSFFEDFSMMELPRQSVSARTLLLEEGCETDRLVYLEQGTAIGFDKIRYGDGHVLNFKEFLAGSHYLTSIEAQTMCRVIYIPREHIRRALSLENSLTWTVARSVAADHLALHGTN
jgi:CRP-like cAMP-binding protein